MELIPGLPYEIAFECLIRVPQEFHSNMRSVCHQWQNLISDPCFYQQRLVSNTSEHIIFQVQPYPKQTSITPSTPTTTAQIINDHTLINNTKNPQNQTHHSPPEYALNLYNITQQTWKRIELGYQFRIPLFCQCVVIESCKKLVLLGGWDPKSLEPVSDVFVLDLVDKRWRKGACMGKARSFFACDVVSGKVYVAGGHDSQKNALKSAEVYDVVKDEWRVLPDMEEERDECLGMCWGDDGEKFWVVSGYGTETQGRFRSDTECYDPSNGSWSKFENVWPFQNLSPKCNTVNLQNREWLWLLSGDQKSQFELCEEKENEKKWKILRSIVELPNSGSGGGGSSSGCVSVTGVEFKQQEKQKVFVNGGRGLKCNECEGEEEAAVIMERDSSNGSIKWDHVHTPPAFSGFPYSAAHILI